MANTPSSHPLGFEPHAHYTVAVDFDGVLHSYISPWEGPGIVPDPPVRGMFEWLLETSWHFKVVVFSTRCQFPEGCAAVKEYLARDHTQCYDPQLRQVVQEPVTGLGNQADALRYSATKGAALVYIDDRAYRFDGTNPPSRREIHRLIPWNKLQANDGIRR